MIVNKAWWDGNNLVMEFEDGSVFQYTEANIIGAPTIETNLDGVMIEDHIVKYDILQ